jgi:hypothetical protein
MIGVILYLRLAYVRLLVDTVKIGRDQIRISGSKGVLAAAVANGATANPEAVRSFAREWHANYAWSCEHYLPTFRCRR